MILLLVLAGTGVTVTVAVTDPATADAVIHAVGESLDPPPRSVESRCIVHTDDLVVDAPLTTDDHIVVVSLHGDIIVDAPLRTADGDDGQIIERIADSPGIGKFHVLGESGGHGGDIVLLAPQGTITIRSDIQAGHGGDGKDAAQSYNNSLDRMRVAGYPADHPVRVYGGYGGFGGSIYLGAHHVRMDDATVLPGAGGRGGDATLDGATRVDVARGGHGGMGGQIYRVHLPTAVALANATAPMGAAPDAQWVAPKEPHAFSCTHPVPLGLDQPLAATVMTPTARTCRGGDGGDATTYGLHDQNALGEGWDESIAGVASAGNGGWGCPGGDGGDSFSYGARGQKGQPGEPGSCAVIGPKDGAQGFMGRDGGWGGHAIAGDGGAGAPGRDLVGSTIPTVWNWLYGWGNEKWIQYPHEGPWPQVDGSRMDGPWAFPLIGESSWYVGGDGGDAISQGGPGGEGGDGGDGRDGLDPGKGGLGGLGGRGAGPASAFGGWGGPGMHGDGWGAAASTIAGQDGLRGLDGADGLTELQC